MKERILDLQRASEILEPTERERRFLENSAIEYSDQFLNRMPGGHAYRKEKQQVHSLLTEPLSEEPMELPAILKNLDEKVFQSGLNASSGGQLGFIPGGGLFGSAVADYLAAVTNPYTGIYYSSPGSVCVETRLIRWMAGLAGYPASAGGYLSSGGSLANLTAVVAARENAEIQPKDVEKSVVYLTDQTHHCVDRALRISGMGSCVIRHIPTDDRMRMDPHRLEETIEEDLKSGLKPWLVVASAGTTNSGSIDPLAEIGKITRQAGTWYHVDAAYGGCFLVTEQGKENLKGIEQSDSVVIDPHKGFFVPYGLGALIVRDEEKLAAAFQAEADYLQDTRIDQPARSPADLSPELSKHFRGLRLWLPLKLYGLQAFRSALEEKLLLAHYAWRELNGIDSVETGPEPDLSVVTFRALPDHGDPELWNRRLLDKIVADGRIYITSTRIGGIYMLRVAVLTLRTHLEDLDRFLMILKEKIDELKSEQG
ncbi:MAG: aminotransferase class V-fold PLP-dependent enzyme [Balneolaceae bacterium]